MFGGFQAFSQIISLVVGKLNMGIAGNEDALGPLKNSVMVVVSSFNPSEKYGAKLKKTIPYSAISGHEIRV